MARLIGDKENPVGDYSAEKDALTLVRGVAVHAEPHQGACLRTQKVRRRALAVAMAADRWGRGLQGLAQLTDALLPPSESAPATAAASAAASADKDCCTSCETAMQASCAKLLWLRMDELRRLACMQHLLLLLVASATLYCLVHWVELAPDLVDFAAALAFVMLLLLLLRLLLYKDKERGKVTELQSALDEAQAAAAAYEKAQQRMEQQLDRVQEHLSGESEHRCRAEAALAQHLALLAQARQHAGEDMESWLGTLDDKMGALSAEVAQQQRLTALQFRSTWIQIKHDLIRNRQLDPSTGIVTEEGVKVLQLLLGSDSSSNDLERLLTDESGLLRITAASLPPPS